MKATLSNLTVLIILLLILVTNHYIAHLKHTQSYMSIISQQSWGGEKQIKMLIIYMTCSFLLKYIYIFSSFTKASWE